MGNYIRQDPLDNILFKDKIAIMASITVESKVENTMVKILSSMNQILLFTCLVMMLGESLFMTENEEDYAVDSSDDDESFLMERADAVLSLLPCIAAFTIGAVVACGGRRILLGVQQ